MESATQSHEQIVASTEAWLVKAVIGLNLCPFAKAVHSKKLILYQVSDARTIDALLDDLLRELEQLAEANEGLHHNAALVNIFGWGVGTKDENPFWKAASSSEALAAYRKFLSGQTLIEDTTDLTSNVTGSLPDKIHTIEAQLPTLLQNHSEQQTKIELLMTQLTKL